MGMTSEEGGLHARFRLLLFNCDDLRRCRRKDIWIQIETLIFWFSFSTFGISTLCISRRAIRKESVDSAP